ncbi:hypothetical protein CPB86DRAFT_814459 [Serendipita vermifera]|nr:hypothetical protein CPB86DRAFT_814459 [Serendipita vermifera]
MQYRRRFQTAPANPRSSKREAMTKQQEDLTTLNLDPHAILVYTDGSQIAQNDGTLAGAGWAVYHLGDIIKTGREGLGNEAEAYDAEMPALANGLCDAIEIAKEVMSSDPRIHHANRKQHISSPHGCPG